MNPALVPLLLEASLRALFAAIAVWAGLRLLGVGNVLVQKAAWGLILIAALAMPLLPHWQVLPASVALHLPAAAWGKVRTAKAAASSAASIPDRYPAPPVSDTDFSGNEISRPSKYQPTDAAPSSADAATQPHKEFQDTAINLKSNGIGVNGTGFSPYIHPIKKTRALAPAGRRLQPAAAPISIPAASAITADSSPSGLSPSRMGSLGWLLYLGVFAALLLRLLFGLATALRLWLTAEPVPAQPGADPTLLLRFSPRVASPVNIGSGILLPAGYAAWDEEKLRIVLAHERSHVRQGDFYLQLLAGLYAALFWFSPLGWWLKRKLYELGEAISDRAGLEEATSRSSYAQLLLEFAALPRPTLAGVAMARTSHLSERIERLLNESSFRHAFAAGGRRALLAVLLVPAAIFAATTLVRVEAAAAPASQAQPTALATPQTPITGQSTPEQVTDQGSTQAPASTAIPTGQPSASSTPSAVPAPPVPPDPAAGPVPQAPQAPQAPPVMIAPHVIVAVPNPFSAPGPQVAPNPLISPHPRIIVSLPDSIDAMGLSKGQLALEIQRGQIHDQLADAFSSGFALNPMYYFNDGDPYAIVGDPGTHVRFSGQWEGDRVQDVEKARKIAHGHFLLFQHEGKTYVIDDPAIVAQVEDMNKPLAALDEQMRALAKQERDFAMQQRDAARQMRQATVPAPDLSKEIAALNAAAASLQAKQGATLSQKDLADLQRQVGQVEGKLGALEGKIEMEQFKVDGGPLKFSEQEGKIGSEMAKLGTQIGQAARENEAKFKTIITDSLSNGKARPLE